MNTQSSIRIIAPIIFICSLLFISLPPTAAQSSPLPIPKLRKLVIKSSPLYIPGSLIIRYQKGNAPDELQQQVTMRTKKAQTAAGRQENRAEDRELLLRGEKTPEEKLATLNTTFHKHNINITGTIFPQLDQNSGKFIIHRSSPQLNINEAVKELKTLPFVESVQPDYLYQPQDIAPPTDFFFSRQWDFSKFQMLKAWEKTKGSNSVKVAVVDTGVNYNHQDFIGRIFSNGYDFTTCAQYDSTGACLIPKSRDPDPMDEDGHGSHVAGTIGAMSNNSLGIAGLNWNLMIMPLRALTSTGGSYSDIYDAVKYAVDNGAKVINLSLGGEAPCDPLGLEQATINYAYAHGVTVVVAAGNSDIDAAGFSPASCQHVISVAATGATDFRSYYSNYGSVVDIAAPGGDDTPCLSVPSSQLQNCYFDNLIISLYMTNTDYYFMEGTSMAAPHISGLAGLMYAINPLLTPDQIEAAIKNNVDPVGTETGKPIGTGRANPDKVLTALSAPTPTPTAPPSPTPTLHPADVNRDGHVSVLDLVATMKAWLTPGTTGNNYREDINRDTKVNGLDLSTILRFLGSI